MPNQKVHVLGHDEIVSMLGLLGIEGTVIKENDDFLKEFNNLVNDPLIFMIIISLDLSDNILDFLIDFKINRRKPFIMYIPDIFNLDSGSANLFLTRVYESINKIIS